MSNKPAADKIPSGFKLRHTLRGHKEDIYSIAWSPDGRTLASCGEEKVIRLWDVETGLPRQTIRNPTGLITSIAWSPDSRLLTTGDNDGRIRIWDALTGGRLQTLGSKNTSVLSITWSTDGRHFISTGFHTHIQMWDGASWKLHETFDNPKGTAYCVAWSPTSKFFLSGNHKNVYLLEADTGRLHQTFLIHEETFTVAWLASQYLFVTGGVGGVIRLWNPHTGNVIRLIEGHTNSITGVSFSADERFLASKSSDNTVRLWRCDKWQCVAILDEPSFEEWLPNPSFHPREPILATLGEKGIIRIWDLDFNVLLGGAREPDDVLYTTAKVTLVGDSGVGKTGLGWNIAHGEFKEHSSTHGQQFWVIDEWGATRKDGTQCEAVLWDLAGQPDYRLVHALFLDDVDLALVLFDPANRQEPLKGVEYWLKHLKRERRDGRKRRVILVGARADRGVPTLTRGELEEFCRAQGVECYVGTSALTGEGLEELLVRVKSSIVWDEMPATVTTKTFKRVKEFVLALKERRAGGGVLVGPKDLRARLEATDASWEFTDAEMMTAVKHLANHGYVSVLRGSSGEETVLLAPDLLANLAASLVLEARRNEKGLGALEESRVLEGRYEFPELNGLDEKERDVLLDAAVVLFIEHNLCFRETLGAQTLLIFPALINQKRPVSVEEAETADDYSYRVAGAVENVYASLVVQLGYTNTFTRTNQWQNQAEYETARGDVCGFRQTDEREGETELVLYYAKERAGARLLFQGLFEQFLRGRDVTVTKFPPVSCPRCGYGQPRTEIVKRIGQGKGFLFCGECGTNIGLPKGGEEVALGATERARVAEEQEHSRRRTAFESALTRVKAFARDNRVDAPSCFVSYAWGDPSHERRVREMARDLENAGLRVLLDRKDNQHGGSSVSRFVSLIDECDFIIPVGTPLYLRKYENRDPEAGTVVSSEVDLINERLSGETEEAKATVVPVLLEGDRKRSLPPLIRTRLHIDFRRDDLYFPSLFDLVLTLYRIDFEHPAVADLRDGLRGWLPTA